MSTTSKTRNKMMAIAIAASMTLGLSSLASPAVAKSKSKSTKKSKSAKAYSKQSNSVRQNNRQSQKANVKGGDGGDSGRVTCINALSGNNVGAGVGILALLFDPPGNQDSDVTQTGGGGQACTSGNGGNGGGNNNTIDQDQGAANVNTGDQVNDGGSGVVQ